jgi:hypothetical protein
MKGLDVCLPASHRLVIGTVEDKLIPVGIREDSNFLVKDAPLVEQLLTGFWVAVIFQGNSDANKLLII